MMRTAAQQGSPARSGGWRHLVAIAGAFGALIGAPARADDSSTGALKKLSVEELLTLDVTSVTKTAEPLSAAPAAIYVITHDDAVRSGATSLPEVLRLAPNLQVVQLSPSNYTITARGFSGNVADQNFSDKLLVLIDGRSVYTPLYSGVYWDAQDVPIDNIERIEVISGPGATLWGANAMNGVINIITRSAADTHGATIDAGAGNLEKGGSAQFGDQLGGASYRVYAKAFERKSLDTPAGMSADDGWTRAQAGFRSDWSPGADSLMLSGDVYRANERQLGSPDLDISGVNLLARWQRRLSADSSLQVQAFYDQTQRFNGVGSGGFVLNTYDLELQHSFPLGGTNGVVWGVGERVNTYDITNTASLLFIPEHRALTLTNVFAQDTWAIAPRLKLTIGLKLEDDPYTGTTPLPSARLSWGVSDSAMLWTAVSRAIRSATPFDRDVAEYLGNTLFLVGGPEFRPEKLTAYELGYRGTPLPGVTLSVSTFYNVYDDLRSIEINPVTLLPLQWGNLMHGDTYGGELWLNYQLTDFWRWTITYNELREHLAFRSGSSQLLGVAQAGDDPRRQASLRTSVNVTPAITFDADLRYVSSLPNPAVSGYQELNLRLGWHITRNWEASLAGANLLHAHHVEYTVPPSDAISRSAFADVRYRF
jgi:iron complex outermembrane receptor protein